jgi:hypothetical protein
MQQTLLKELEQLIEYRARDLVSELPNDKEKYEDLESDLRSMIEDAKSFKEDMDKHNLTFSAIESEGYLRFALNVENLLNN